MVNKTFLVGLLILEHFISEILMTNSADKFQEMQLSVIVNASGENNLTITNQNFMKLILVE